MAGRLTGKFRMKPTAKVAVLLTASVLLMVTSSSIPCHGKPVGVDSLYRLLIKYELPRNSDSIISIGRRIFYSEKDYADDIARLYAGIYCAQEFAYTEHLDSAAHYLELIRPQRNKITGTFLEGMLYIVEASMKINSGRDFSAAIDLFTKSYRAFEKTGDIDNAIIPLGNLVQMCYMLHDLQGMDYAEKAYGLADRANDPWAKYIATLCMAQMTSLAEKPEAPMYTGLADSLITAYGWEFHRYMTYLLYAEQAKTRQDYATADSLFERSLDCAENFSNEPSGIQQVCLEWGKLCEKLGDYPRAAELYRKGLDITGISGSYILTDKLLLSLSDCFVRTGDNDSSLYYYKMYIALADSLDVTNRDKEKDMLILNYKQMEQQSETKARESELMKSERKMIILSICLLIMALLTSGLVFWSKRTKKKGSKTGLQQKRDEPADASLWKTVETLMGKEKLFTKNSLTLESLAADIGTNRTYLSRTINSFAGVNFNAYIDKYRIKEAVRIIEQSNEKIPFAEIAEMVGYNSAQVFYKAFQRETGLSPGKYRDETMRRRSNQ